MSNTETQLIGQVVKYVGSITEMHTQECVVVDYSPFRGTYTLEPLSLSTIAGRNRLFSVNRVSFLVQGETRPVCACGHIVRPNRPTNLVCIKCECTEHRDRSAVPADGELADEELFERVRTGGETVTRDNDGRPVAVTIPFADYLAQRANAAFHRA